jgi:hypothetical protein
VLQQQQQQQQYEMNERTGPTAAALFFLPIAD